MAKRPPWAEAIRTTSEQEARARDDAEEIMQFADMLQLVAEVAQAGNVATVSVPTSSGWVRITFQSIGRVPAEPWDALRAGLAPQDQGGGSSA